MRQPTTHRSAAASGPGDAASGTMDAPWNFLTNHAHVLVVLCSEPDLVLREVALRVGITERAVQRIVQELEEEGFLQRERIGRRNHYQIIKGKHLRHPVESHCTVDQVLRLVAKKNAAKKVSGSRTKQTGR